MVGSTLVLFCFYVLNLWKLDVFDLLNEWRFGSWGHEHDKVWILLLVFLFWCIEKLELWITWIKVNLDMYHEKDLINKKFKN